jgi:hypothetical protein
VAEDDQFISVDSYGVTHISDDEAAMYPVAIDYSDVLYMGTQQSSNMSKGKRKVSYEVVPVGVIEEDDMFMWEGKQIGEYNPEDHDKGIAEELELIKQLKRQKKEAAEEQQKDKQKQKMKLKEKDNEDSDDEDIHIEGDTDVEEFFEGEEDSEQEEEEDEGDVEEVDFTVEKKKAMRPGPTTRSHHEEEFAEPEDFLPSGDEDCHSDELVGSDDDDGWVKKFVLPSGKGRRQVKVKKRVWYDEAREDAHEQFALKLCFRDVYQFRVALRNYHIAQLRNFSYHRNNPDSIIVECSEKKHGCPFYLTASEIAHEKTFCIRKFRAMHTCIPHGENTKVSIDWLAHQSEQAMRTDPNTCVDTLIDNAKQRFGVEVPRSKAYRARKKAFDTVMGDQKKQYTRLRDYLQAILDTNPGSRCIVTCRHLVEHPSINPRFHGLFICLNASKEGFLQGCRPFIGMSCIQMHLLTSEKTYKLLTHIVCLVTHVGVDGCFIKLTTGQQILAATGRDGNNNIFPVAFGVVDKEDYASWLWFLTQLKSCIGESSKFGNYTIISDRQKVK